MRSYEDCIIPTTSVTGNELQQIWKQGYAPRQLDSGDLAFECYMSRCRRKDLVEYVEQLLSSGGSGAISNVIHCSDYYYLVFRGNTAPSRDRWKKYKGRVTAEGMHIVMGRVRIGVKSAQPDYEKGREVIEEMTNKWVRRGGVRSRKATLCVDKGVVFAVGEKDYITSVYSKLAAIVLWCCLFHTVQRMAVKVQHSERRTQETRRRKEMCLLI